MLRTACCSAWGAVELVDEEFVVAGEGHDLRPAVARHLTLPGAWWRGVVERRRRGRRV